MRSRVLPDVPTIAEAGVHGFDAVIWLGIVAPADTPKPIVDKLNAAVNYTIARPEIVAAWKRQGATPMAMTPDEFDAFLRKDIEKWAQVAKFSGMIGQQGRSRPWLLGGMALPLGLSSTPSLTAAG
jgi:tripartite-type tricarboxylate transporter receptor subunit TctC